MVHVQLEGIGCCWPPSVLKGRRRPSVPQGTCSSAGGVGHSAWMATHPEQGDLVGRGARIWAGVPNQKGCVTVLLGAGRGQQHLHCYKAGRSSVAPRMEGYWELGCSISVGSREEVTKGSGESWEVTLLITVNFRKINAENRIGFAKLFITWVKSLFTQKTYHVCGTPLTVKV